MELILLLAKLNVERWPCGISSESNMLKNIEWVNQVHLLSAKKVHILSAKAIDHVYLLYFSQTTRMMGCQL